MFPVMTDLTPFLSAMIDFLKVRSFEERTWPRLEVDAIEFLNFDLTVNLGFS